MKVLNPLFVLLPLFSIGCAHSAESASVTKDVPANSSSFSGKYVLTTVTAAASGSSFLSKMTVSSGECSFNIGASDSQGWRNMDENANCELAAANIPKTPIIAVSKSKVKIDSNGKVVDGKVSASSMTLGSDLSVSNINSVFTEKSFVQTTDFIQKSDAGQKSFRMTMLFARVE